jgi:hypothetical protein
MVNDFRLLRSFIVVLWLKSTARRTLWSVPKFTEYPLAPLGTLLVHPRGAANCTSVALAKVEFVAELPVFVVLVPVPSSNRTCTMGVGRPPPTVVVVVDVVVVVVVGAAVVVVVVGACVVVVVLVVVVVVVGVTAKLAVTPMLVVTFESVRGLLVLLSLHCTK